LETYLDKLYNKEVMPKDWFIMLIVEYGFIRNDFDGSRKSFYDAVMSYISTYDYTSLLAKQTN